MKQETNFYLVTLLKAGLISVSIFLTPIKGLLITTGLFVLLDTIFAVYATIKLNGWKSYQSTKLFNIAVKTFFYLGSIVLAFFVDTHIVENNAGNDCQTLAESSFDTWIKYYRPNENTGNTQVSYYRKGALVVMLMDIIIQYYSGGKFSLDNLMHSAFKDTLVSNYSGITKPYIIEKLEQICLYDWNTFYENCIESTQPLAISEIFKLSNYQLSISDKNSKTIGVKLKKVGEQFAISSMDKNYFKFNGQLQVDDIVLKIDNQELINNFDEIIEQKAIGKILNFYIRRDGIDKEVEVMLTRSIDKRFTVSPK